MQIIEPLFFPFIFTFLYQTTPKHLYNRQYKLKHPEVFFFLKENLRLNYGTVLSKELDTLRTKRWIWNVKSSSWNNGIFNHTLSMVPPWLLHGLSIDFPLIDGGTMDEPWTNHGGTPYQTPISLP
jgi:hypothetical protein